MGVCSGVCVDVSVCVATVIVETPISILPLERERSILLFRRAINQSNLRQFVRRGVICPLQPVVNRVNAKLLFYFANSLMVKIKIA